MKTAKKIISAILFATMLTSTMGVVYASDTDPITIDSVIFSEYKDGTGTVDNTLLNATATYTVVSDADQVSILVTSEDITEITDANESKVIYIDQVERADDGTLNFVIEKSRVAEAIGSETINGTTLYVKMGGMNVETMASKTVTLTDPADAVVSGDANGDGKVTAIDGTFTLRYIAGWPVANANVEAMDVSGDNRVTAIDGTFLLRYIAGWPIELK